MPALVGPSSMQKISAAFKGSPGKSTAIAALVVVLIVAWGRVLMGGHTGPATANGATKASAAVVSAPVDSTSFRRSNEDSSSLQRWAEEKVKPLSRNPFAIPLDFYPHDGSKEGSDDGPAAGYWDLVRKSMSSRADQQEQRQIMVDNVRIAAGQLKLESTILGAAPVAMLNGQMVREGSVVSGFHVLKIEARQVIVEREGIKLALMMD